MVYYYYVVGPFEDVDDDVVDGVVELKGLVTEIKKTQKIVDGDDVLNGIAFDNDDLSVFEHEMDNFQEGSEIIEEEEKTKLVEHLFKRNMTLLFFFLDQ